MPNAHPATAASLAGRERIRLGYVGCGMMAQSVHLPNFTSLPGCELVALAEVRRKLGERVRAAYGVPRLYRDHRELAEDPEVDAVGVSAAWAVQGEIARDMLLAGKHVFVEKPLFVSVAQAERILGAARATGARLMVGYMKRYDAGNRLARDTIAAWRASGELGAITYARAHGFGGDWTGGNDVPLLTTDEPIPPARTAEHLPAWLPPEWGEPYVVYLQQYTHNVNLLRFLLGAGDSVRVRHADLNPDGYAGTVVLDVEGVRAVLETGNLAYHRWDEHTQVYFDRGWVHVWSPPLLLRNAVAEVELYRSDEGRHTHTRPIPEPRWSWVYRREAEHFIERLRSGEPFESSGEDTLADVRAFGEIYWVWLQL